MFSLHIPPHGAFRLPCKMPCKVSDSPAGAPFGRVCVLYLRNLSHNCTTFPLKANDLVCVCVCAPRWRGGSQVRDLEVIDQKRSAAEAAGLGADSSA